MELKDVILSTIAEMEEPTVEPTKSSDFEVKETIAKIEKRETVRTEVIKEEYQDEEVEKVSDSELAYLRSIRERLLVLFEGFQAPNNKDIEAKVDMTLNFLEYILATIDSRIESLGKGQKK